MKYQIKLLCSWTSCEDILNQWSKQSLGNNDWNDIEFSYNKSLDEYDFFVIVNGTFEKHTPSKSIVIQMEPFIEDKIEWNNWYTNKNDYLFWMDLNNFFNNNEWHLKHNYSELITLNIPKTKVISSVVSGLYHMENHKKRIDFLKYLEQNFQNEFQVDIYGKSNPHAFSNYLSSLPSLDKSDGLFPYKYTFSAENTTKIPRYYTEKLVDSILSECVCFYSGPKQVENVIDNRAYIFIDLYKNSFEHNANIIKDSIINDEYTKRLPIIKSAKHKLLNFLQFFPRMNRLVKVLNSKFDNGLNSHNLKIPIYLHHKDNLSHFHFTKLQYIPVAQSSDFCEKLANLSSLTERLHDFVILIDTRVIDFNQTFVEYHLIKSNFDQNPNFSAFNLALSNFKLDLSNFNKYHFYECTI